MTSRIPSVRSVVDLEQIETYHRRVRAVLLYLRGR